MLDLNRKQQLAADLDSARSEPDFVSDEYMRKWKQEEIEFGNLYLDNPEQALKDGALKEFIRRQIKSLLK